MRGEWADVRRCLLFTNRAHVVGSPSGVDQETQPTPPLQ